MRTKKFQWQQESPELSFQRINTMQTLEQSRAFFTSYADEIHEFVDSRGAYRLSDLIEEEKNLLVSWVTEMNKNSPLHLSLVGISSESHITQPLVDAANNEEGLSVLSGVFIGTFLGFSIGNYVVEEVDLPLGLAAKTVIEANDGIPRIAITSLREGTITLETPTLN